MKRSLNYSLCSTRAFLACGILCAALHPVRAAQLAQPGDAFDAVPFGFPIAPEGKSLGGVRWAEPRKIRRVVVTFAGDGPLAGSDQVRLQYWHASWDGAPEPIAAEKGAGRVGWEQMDDWTNGKWNDAVTHVESRGRKCTFTFAPTGEKEFPQSMPGVTYRKTLQLRLVSESDLPRLARLQAFTDAVYRPLSVRILFGRPVNQGILLSESEQGHLEVFNGAVLAVRGMGGAEADDDHLSWKAPSQAQACVETDLLVAVDALASHFDRTIVTVRSNDRPFSFATEEIAAGQRILVDDLGVLVVPSGDPISLEGYRTMRKEFPGQTVYGRVFDQPEQTLKSAWDAMPLKRPLYFVHGLPGNRNAMHQNPDGAVVIGSRKRWFNLPRSAKDTPRKKWGGELLTLGFGFPNDEHVNQRALKDGYLPLLTTWYRNGSLSYEQHTILDTLRGGLENVTLDDPSLLLMHVRIANTSMSEKATASLLLTSKSAEPPEKLTFDQGRVLGVWQNKLVLRYVAKGLDKGKIDSAESGLHWTLALAPGEIHDVYFLIPSITLDQEAEIAPLFQRDFTSDAVRVCRYWQEVTAKGCEIRTPEPWLNDFFKAHVRHMLVNSFKEIGSDRLHAHVGTFAYGVYPDESVMMINNLDLRGYHDEARRCYQSFLDYQGTVPMPGNFKTTKGLFYGSGGHQDGGYNKSHAWVMWGMAQHWAYTRDRTWMEAVAPKLIKSCDWITRERQATMKTNSSGSRPLEYGFLPSGSLEDVTDYWSWLVTNACTDWGFRALAGALADYGHPEAQRLQKDSKAFHEDLMRGFEESRVLAPVVRLRDGTCVPKYPSRLYERGRSHGWLRETLEGSIHLLITDLIDQRSPQADWILKDFEDNLYISQDYGYAIPSFNVFWFSRGGFSMQPNLLGGPLPYLYRDEIKHFLRAYFNSLVSSFYPDIRMCNEHCLPELGYPAGDHFKSSDEAQSNYWLRLMFVSELGGDLYLGQAIPRDWLGRGQSIGIDRAATYYGPLSLNLTPEADGGRMRASLDRPQQQDGVNPRTIYLRLRHPKEKKIKEVTVNGQPHAQFDPQKEWVILPGNLTERIEVIASY